MVEKIEMTRAKLRSYTMPVLVQYSYIGEEERSRLVTPEYLQTRAAAGTPGTVKEDE